MQSTTEILMVKVSESEQINPAVILAEGLCTWERGIEAACSHERRANNQEIVQRHFSGLNEPLDVQHGSRPAQAFSLAIAPMLACCLDAWTPGRLDVWTPGCLGIRTSDSWMSGLYVI